MSHIILFDPMLRRPGCALLAAAAGADRSWLHRIDSRHWLTAPTEHMGKYRVSDDELSSLINYLNTTPVRVD